MTKKVDKIEVLKDPLVFSCKILKLVRYLKKLCYKLLKQAQFNFYLYIYPLKKKKKRSSLGISPKFLFWRKIIAFSKKKLRLLLLIDKTCAKLICGPRARSWTTLL